MAEQDDAVETLRTYCLLALSDKSSGTSAKNYSSLVERVRTLKHATRPTGGVAPGTGAVSLAAFDYAALQSLPAYVALLKGLTQCVSSLHERKHESLLREVLDIPLWRVHPAVRSAVLDFITHICVANGSLIPSCLQALVYALLPPPGPPQPDPCPGDAWAPAPEDAAVQDEVVGALGKVLLLVPTSSSRALPLLLGSVPHKLRDRGTQCLYLRALFSLAEGPAGVAVRDGVLQGVMDHLTSIDVEIRWEDIVEQVSEETKEEEGGMPPAEDEEPDIFELEGMSELDLHSGGGGHEAGGRGGWEGGARIKPASQQQLKDAPEGARPPAVNETADKLDSLMELTLAHLARRCESGGLPSAWAALAASFERTVLQTHRSKFVQFAVFFTCRLAPDACGRAFLHSLLVRLTDAQQPPITRSAAAAYIASFLARAAFVPEPLVVECLQRVTEWCVRYTRDEDRRGGLPPIPSTSSLQNLSSDAAARHAAFFAACQAVLYVLCYHMEPLLRHHRPASAAGAAGAAGSAAGHAANGLANGAVGMQRQEQQVQQAQQAASSASTMTGLPAGTAGISLGGLGLGQATPPVAPGNSAAGLPPLPPSQHTSAAHHPHSHPRSASPSASPNHHGHSHSPGPHSSAHHPQHHGTAQREACAAAVHALLTAGLPRLLSHSLDPLSSCAKSVVLEFARQARILGLSEVSKAVREWEKRQADPSTAHRPRPLEMFFPFDPYLLRRSAALLDLPATYVSWRRGHPTGAVRADLESSSSDEEEEEGEEEDMSEGESESSSGLSSSSASSSDGESEDDSDDDSDDLRRTRFGSMPDSFPSSGGSGRGRRALRRHHHRSSRPHLPGALKVSLAHGGSLGAGSPTMGFALPGGSYSTDGGMGSPAYGTSPYGMYGTSFGLAPMSCTPNQ